MIGQPYERSLPVMIDRDPIILNVKISCFKHPTDTIDSNIDWHLWPIFVLITALQCRSYPEMLWFEIISLLCLQKGMLTVFNGIKGYHWQSKLTEVLLRKGDWWKFWGSSEFVIHLYSKSSGGKCQYRRRWIWCEPFLDASTPDRLLSTFSKALTCLICSCKHSDHPAKIISRK